MYVRLKHGLSALALESIGRPDGGLHRDAAVVLKALCHAAGPEGAPVPAAALAARVRRRCADAWRALRWLIRRGFLERRGDAVALPSGYAPHAAYLCRQVGRLDAILRRLASSPRPRGRSGTIRRGLALFDGGLFFECHEYFEDLWRRAPADGKAFYQGIILVAAGLYHFEKGNRHGARAKLSAGLQYLKRFSPAKDGIDVDRWVKRLEPWSAKVDSGEPGGALRSSQIPKAAAARAAGPRPKRCVMRLFSPTR
jgi:hypothetical protein